MVEGGGLRLFIETIRPQFSFYSEVTSRAARKRHRRPRPLIAGGGARDVRRLPDFFIGAHAAIARHLLLTRDAVRCRAYSPSVALIAPD